MKLNKHALHLACLAALGSMGSAHAVQVAGEALEVYGALYPQYQITSFADGSTAPLSNLTAGKVTPGVGTAPTLVNKTQVNWVNSYIGFKGQRTFGDIKAGYDFQAVVMKNGTTPTETTGFSEARDAFVFISHNSLGTLQMGQMDTIYKEFGDRVRMLGISSSNFVSTSGVLSGPGWKSQNAVAGSTVGVTTFNTRINGQVRYLSPTWNGIQVGLSLRPDPNASATSDASLQAMGARWSNANYYVGVAQEVHNDYRAFSGTIAPAGTTIFNASTTRSKDTATRLTFGYTAEKFRLGADFANLKYTEDGAVGKFANYETNTWQISGEYSLNPQVTLAANYANGSEGSCALVGGAACTTTGLGGSLVSLGARYDYDKNVGFFAIYGQNNVGNSAVYASGNVGGNVTNMAIGLNVKF